MMIKSRSMLCDQKFTDCIFLRQRDLPATPCCPLRSSSLATWYCEPALAPSLETSREVLCFELGKRSLRLFLNRNDVIKSSSLQCQLKFRKRKKSVRLPDLRSKQGAKIRVVPFLATNCCVYKAQWAAALS